MTRYFLLIVLSICFIGCDKEEDDPNVICDPAIPSYEPIYIRLLDNSDANLLGTANYVISNMEAKQTCTNEMSEVKLVKGLIAGSSDSVLLLKITLAGQFNGNTCNDFSIKWNNTDTDNFTVSFRDSVIDYGDGCEGHIYFQSINENGTAVTQLKNIKTDYRYADNHGYNTYYVIRK